MAEVFPYTHPTGYMFSPGERVALATSLPLLAHQSKRQNIGIWGKIFGFKADYIIVQAFEDDLVAEPELFYTVDGGLTFTLLGTTSSLMNELPNAKALNELDRQQLKASLVEGMRGSFVGDPSYEYRIINDITGEANSYKESFRVALFVEEHDYCCRVAPRGAYFKAERNKNTTDEVRRNGAFTGLARNNDECLTLRSYYHIRSFNAYRRLLASEGNTLFTANALQKWSENRQIDAIFDTIADDIPTGLWRLRYDPLHDLVVGSNAKFIGSIFYHVPETSVFGTVYMGDGTVNRDLAFQI